MGRGGSPGPGSGRGAGHTETRVPFPARPRAVIKCPKAPFHGVIGAREQKRTGGGVRPAPRALSRVPQRDQIRDGPTHTLRQAGPPHPALGCVCRMGGIAEFGEWGGGPLAKLPGPTPGAPPLRPRRHRDSPERKRGSATCPHRRTPSGTWSPALATGTPTAARLRRGSAPAPGSRNPAGRRRAQHKGSEQRTGRPGRAPLTR